MDCKEISHLACGTTILVTDLFYNIPVRRKVELRASKSHLKTSIEMIALGFPHISFIYKDDYHNIQTNGSGDCIDTFKTLFGQSLLPSISVIDIQDANISIKGFISDHLFHSKAHQYIYVNDQYISKSAIHESINLKNQNGFSIFVLNLRISSDLISLLKRDCYSYELKLVDDSVLKILGLNTNTSTRITQKKRKMIPCTAIRSSNNVDYDEVFKTSPFELSVHEENNSRNGKIRYLKIQKKQ